ncbi:MAG: hypothetical protein ACRC7W_05660 [Fusobacteriaceae bacterium]
MKKQIDGFSEYYYLDGKIFRNKDDSEVTITVNKSKKNSKFLKLKNDCGKWKSIGYGKILSLSGQSIPTEGFTRIPNTKCSYINEEGAVLSFWFRKEGVYPKIHYPKKNNKYPSVGIEGKVRFIHQLLAITFLDENYTSKGLVVMHLDNNKNNHTLSNIKIGTYSENNKQAYADGLNKGNGFKKI